MKRQIIDRHHLLEIILWPNEDGTFKEIRNSRERLKELGIYDDWKLTINITREEHTSLHNKGIFHLWFKDYNDSLRENGLPDETKKKISETLKKNEELHKPKSEEHKKKISEAHKGKPHPHKGQIHSEETRKKMSERAKSRTHELRSEFSIKFFEHFGIRPKEDQKLYNHEEYIFKKLKKCSWEVS